MPSRNRSKERRREREENGPPVVFVLTPQQARTVTAAAETNGVDDHTVSYMHTKIARREALNAQAAADPAAPKVA